MTKITYIKQDDYFHLKVDGHAGYAEKGADIVCAAVSALCCTLASRVTDILDSTQYDIHVDRKDGIMSIVCKGAKAMDAFETVLPGLEQAAIAFPEYVSIRDITNGGV